MIRWAFLLSPGALQSPECPCNLTSLLLSYWFINSLGIDAIGHRSHILAVMRPLIGGTPCDVIACHWRRCWPRRSVACRPMTSLRAARLSLVPHICDVTPYWPIAVSSLPGTSLSYTLPIRSRNPPEVSATVHCCFCAIPTGLTVFDKTTVYI